MHIVKITLSNFRSFLTYEVSFDKDLNVIVAPNGSGKSNLLEAIGILGTGSSVRAGKVTESIRWGQDVARVEAVLSDNTRIGISITPTKKYFFVNNTDVSFAQYLQHLSVVYFQPHDLRLVSGGPHNRRLFMDRTLATIDPTYLHIRQEFMSNLAQRNALLKDTRSKSALFDTFEQVLSVRMVDVITMRWGFISRMNTALLPHGIFLEYKPSPSVLRELLPKITADIPHELPHDVAGKMREIVRRKLRDLREKEQRLGFSLIGPQRDEVSIFINDPVSPRGKKDVLVYGSRGQQRITVITLLLKTADIIEHSRGVRPLLLLDDVFSELDGDNRTLLLSSLSKQQTFITAPDESEVSMLSIPPNARIQIYS